MPPRPPDFDPTDSSRWPRAAAHSDFIRFEARIGDQVDLLREHLAARIDDVTGPMREQLAKITDVLTQQVLFNERQTSATRAHEELRDRVTLLESKTSETRSRLESWINYGVGAWFLATAGFALYKALS